MSNVCSATLLPKILGGFVLGCCLAFIPSVVQAATANSATLQWAANSEPDLAGYKVYQGTTAWSYGPSIDVKKVTTYRASNLRAGLTYFFAITAYDLSGNESAPSNDVSKYIPGSSVSQGLTASHDTAHYQPQEGFISKAVGREKRRSRWEENPSRK